MFESDAWSYIIFGFTLGIISTLFIVKVIKEETINIRILILYALTVSLVTFLYSSAASGGLLEEWQLLGFPSLTDKGAKVLEIGYVQAQSGNISLDKPIFSP